MKVSDEQCSSNTLKLIYTGYINTNSSSTPFILVQVCDIKKTWSWLRCRLANKSRSIEWAQLVCLSVPLSFPFSSASHCVVTLCLCKHMWGGVAWDMRRDEVILLSNACVTTSILNAMYWRWLHLFQVGEHLYSIHASDDTLYPERNDAMHMPQVSFHVYI